MRTLQWIFANFPDPSHVFITGCSAEQQRVGIARAIVHRPALLVADEPTGNLDPELSARVMRMFTQFQQLGVTILVATHERAVVESLPFRRLVIERGQLVSDGLGANR